MLLTIFNSIPDHRRGQGRMYQLEYILLFSTFAILSGADSYRKMEIYIKENFSTLKNKFNLEWKKPPAYGSIRYILLGINPKELEKAFRKYSLEIARLDRRKHIFIHLDGKALNHSFDNFKDNMPLQILSAFLNGKDLILAHEAVSKGKENEIEMAKKVIIKLGIKAKIVFTMDALHCQKKL